MKKMIFCGMHISYKNIFSCTLLKFRQIHCREDLLRKCICICSNFSLTRKLKKILQNLAVPVLPEFYEELESFHVAL